MRVLSTDEIGLVSGGSYEGHNPYVIPYETEIVIRAPRMSDLEKWSYDINNYFNTLSYYEVGRGITAAGDNFIIGAAVASAVGNAAQVVPIPQVLVAAGALRASAGIFTAIGVSLHYGGETISNIQ